VKSITVLDPVRSAARLLPDLAAGRSPVDSPDLADLGDRAGSADLGDRAGSADLGDRAGSADLGDRAGSADRSDLADGSCEVLLLLAGGRRSAARLGASARTRAPPGRMLR
jgi:hypothetical protein